MKKYINGEYYSISDNEFQELKEKFYTPNLELSIQERIEKLEQLFENIKEIFHKMGVNL